MKPTFRIAHAESERDVVRCHPVMAQLRPHLTEGELVARVRRQQAQGYRLAFLESEGSIRSVAGYRFGEYLAWGRICYVDDLVTDESARSRGLGGLLFDWLVERAREAGCAQFHLDSGVQRLDAHRFYLAKGMTLSCHHFELRL